MEEIDAVNHMPMEALYGKLHDKYSKLKKGKESSLDELNRDQEKKFLDCIAAADEMIDHLKSENEKLHGEVDDLKSELASIRSFTEEQQIQFQKLLEEEKQKRKPQPSLSPAASFPSDMEFWGVKVKSGGLLKVTPGEGMVVHVTQASLGKMKKKAKNSARLFVHTDGKKFVLAKLSANNLPQQQLNLVFEKDFELSHNWKKGSVYLFGYKAQNPRADDGKSDLGSEDSDSDEKYPIRETMKPIASSKEFTPGKQKVKIVEQNKDLVPEEDDKDIYVNEDDSKEEGDEHSSGDESDKSDKETLQKVDPTKKRAAESATKMPVQDKRAKVTPHKADGKKGTVHLATPHPVKQAGEPHANKPDQLTPIPRGSISCNSCNRVFINEKALESHSKAKHGWQ